MQSLKYALVFCAIVSADDCLEYCELRSISKIGVECVNNQCVNLFTVGNIVMHKVGNPSEQSFPCDLARLEVMKLHKNKHGIIGSGTASVKRLPTVADNPQSVPNGLTHSTPSDRWTISEAFAHLYGPAIKGVEYLVSGSSRTAVKVPENPPPVLAVNGPFHLPQSDTPSAPKSDMCKAFAKLNGLSTKGVECRGVTCINLFWVDTQVVGYGISGAVGSSITCDFARERVYLLGVGKARITIPTKLGPDEQTIRRFETHYSRPVNDPFAPYPTAGLTVQVPTTGGTFVKISPSTKPYIPPVDTCEEICRIRKLAPDCSSVKCEGKFCKNLISMHNPRRVQFNNSGLVLPKGSELLKCKDADADSINIHHRHKLRNIPDFLEEHIIPRGGGKPFKQHRAAQLLSSFRSEFEIPLKMNRIDVVLPDYPGKEFSLSIDTSFNDVLLVGDDHLSNKGLLWANHVTSLPGIATIGSGMFQNKGCLVRWK